MELLRRMEPFSLHILFLGALDWGILGVFNTNLFTQVFGSGDLLTAAYTVVGAAALLALPPLMETVLHVDMHRPHAHRA
jgi:uncharacterized membrane protein YuzA (DUF378 family)